MGPAAVNGRDGGGCRRGPPVSTSCHFSLMASSPWTSESGSCNLQSFSGDLPRNGNPRWSGEGGAEMGRGWDLVIYLPDAGLCHIREIQSSFRLFTESWCRMEGQRLFCKFSGMLYQDIWISNWRNRSCIHSNCCVNLWCNSLNGLVYPCSDW